MIDRCPGDVAIWSENGENFVVKNVEKFASVSTTCTVTAASSQQAPSSY